MPKPAMWPIWRNPLAYGHATATRIFLGVLVPLTDANHRERSPQDPAGAETAEGEHQESREHEHCRPEIASIRGRPAPGGAPPPRGGVAAGAGTARSVVGDSPPLSGTGSPASARGASSLTSGADGDGL